MNSSQPADKDMEVGELRHKASAERESYQRREERETEARESKPEVQCSASHLRAALLTSSCKPMIVSDLLSAITEVSALIAATATASSGSALRAPRNTATWWPSSARGCFNEACRAECWRRACTGVPLHGQAQVMH